MFIKAGQSAGMGKGREEAGQGGGRWQGQVFGVANKVAEVTGTSQPRLCLETLLCGSLPTLQGVAGVWGLDSSLPSWEGRPLPQVTDGSPIQTATEATSLEAGSALPAAYRDRLSSRLGVQRGNVPQLISGQVPVLAPVDTPS